MRAVLDTNVVLSALLWGGVPRQLLDAAAQRHIELASSPALLAELRKALAYPKFTAQITKRGTAFTDAIDGYASLVAIVSPSSVPRVVRDCDDDHVIACAVAAKADVIVSGDHDLLVLKNHQGIDILTPTQALDRCRQNVSARSPTR